MNARCHNKDDVNNKYWAGRGITVDPRWRGEDGYAHFLEDMGRRPSPKHSLERKKNELGYSKENCAWATVIEQARNKRSNHPLTLNGVTMCITAWAEHLRMPTSRIYRRLAKGLPIEQVLARRRLR
jgi:hypothetical protein